MPSSTLASTMKAATEINRKPDWPPGTAAMLAARSCEKPDCVTARAIALAAPTYERIRYGDGRDLGCGRDPFHHGAADQERMMSSWTVISTWSSCGARWSGKRLRWRSK